MNNSFFSISNQSGIACVSDTDGSLYQLSKKEPLAIAVCPHSPIPWDKIITDYKLKGEPMVRHTLEEYVKDFENFLQSCSADLAWNKLDEDQLKIIFFGYGCDSLYPSVCDVFIKIDKETNKIKFAKQVISSISVDGTAYFSWIGNFDRLLPIFLGCTPKVANRMTDKQQKLIESYKEKVIAKFKDTKHEGYIKDFFDKCDFSNDLHNITSDADATVTKKIFVGMGTFSIEDMLYSCEKIVTANVRLNNLLNHNGFNTSNTVKEIAVINLIEGFNWIKHSLFAI